MLPMAVTQLQRCVLTLPSCYNAKMVVEIAELLAGPRLAVSDRPALLQVTSAAVLGAAAAGLGVVLQNSLE